MLDPLHAGDNDQIQKRPLTILLADFMLSLLDQSPHRLTDFAAGFRLQLLHGLFNPVDLSLGLFDVQLDALRNSGAVAIFSAFCMQRSACFSAL